jgi:hypothetical protein
MKLVAQAFCLCATAQTEMSVPLVCRFSFFPLDKTHPSGYRPRSKFTPEELRPKGVGILANEARCRDPGKIGGFFQILGPSSDLAAPIY